MIGPVWVVNILLAFFISLAFYITLPVETKKTLLVPKGSIENIIAQLAKEGYDVGIIDRTILRLIGTPKSGWVDIGETTLNRIDFLYKLTSPTTMIHKVTLIPGETSVIFFENIAKQLDLNSSKLQSYYNKFSLYPEAGIFADTYHVPYGIKEKNLMSFLLKVSNKKYKQLSIDSYGDYNTSKWLQTLITASIIQKEAANVQEMPIIASVIVNRIQKGMRLQMDGTLNYGKYSHIKVTPERIKKDKSRFNTYKYKGLPHSPIGSVGLNALRAAMKPAKTNYLYFMKNTQGIHDFTNSYKKHRENIKKAR